MRTKNGLLKKVLVFSAGIAVFQLGLCFAASLPAGTGNLLGDNGFEFIKGAIAFESIPPDLTEQDVRLNIGNSTITIPAGSFKRVGKSGLKYRCVNTRIEHVAIVNAIFDLQNSSFLIKIKNAKIDTGSGVLVFNLAMGGFSEGVSVETGR